MLSKSSEGSEGSVRLMNPYSSTAIAAAVDFACGGCETFVCVMRGVVSCSGCFERRGFTWVVFQWGRRFGLYRLGVDLSWFELEHNLNAGHVDMCSESVALSALL